MPTFEGVIFLGKPTRVDAGTHNGARNKPNEDRFDAFTAPGDNGQPVQFLVVADGVTSTHGGERASDIAVRLLQQSLQAPAQLNGRPTSKSLRDRLADAIHRANQEILEAARKDPELKGMSTTLVVVAIDGDQAMIMHLGDSRAYLIRNGTAHQLTRDHTWVQEAMDEGRITREQAASHPNRHVILRYLGDARGISIDQGILNPEKPLMDIDETEVGRQQDRSNDTTLTLRPGDALLLCSDGLYGRISDGEIAAAVTRSAPEKAVKSMIDEAVKRDEPDNITVVLWTTAEVKAAAMASTAPRLALLLAAAGALLAILAFLLLSQVDDRPNGVQATASPAAMVAVVADVTPTPTAVIASPTADPFAALDPTSTALPASTVIKDVATETPADALKENAPSEAQMPGETPTPESVETSDASSAPGSDEAANTQVAAVMETQQASLSEAASATSPVMSATRNVTPTRTPAPTSTPLPSPSPTSTAMPTNTPTATRLPAATTGSAATASQEGGPTQATVELPPDNAASNAPTRFKWTANAALAEGQAFEVLFWRPGEEGRRDGRSVKGASSESDVMLPIDTLAQGGYQWGVWLVRVSPPVYEKIRMLAGPFTFTVSPGGGGPRPEPTEAKPK